MKLTKYITVSTFLANKYNKLANKYLQLKILNQVPILILNILQQASKTYVIPTKHFRT